MEKQQILSEEEKKTLEDILEYLTDEYDVDSQSLADVDEIINQMWEESSYTLLDALEVYFASEFIHKAPLHFVQTVFKDAGIIITSKDRKRGRKAIFRRFLTKYHKPKVYSEFQNLTRSLHREALGALYMGSFTPTALEKYIDDYGFYSVLHVACDIEESQPELLAMLHEHYPTFMLHAKITFYLMLNYLDFDTVMNNPEKLSLANSPDTNALSSENKILKRKVNKKQKEKKSLQEQIHVLQQEKKKVEGENYRLYKESLQEIQSLQQEMERMKEEHEKEISTLLNIIEGLSNTRPETDSNNTSDNSLSLNGKTICLVGGSRIRHFRHITELYGGRMCFVAEDQLKLVKGSVSRSDAVFFLKEIASHTLLQETLSAAKEFNVPFFYLNSKGTSRFEQDLIQYIKGELVPLT